MPIDVTSKLAKLDIKTLIVFLKVYDFRSVTEAAKVLDLQQSNVSRAITAMRVAVEDEVFYRRKAGLVPTALADKIYAHTANAIKEISAGFNEEVIITSNPRIVVHASALFIPIISRALCANSHAFGIDVSSFVIRTKTERSYDQLCEGEVDIVFSLEELHKQGVSNTKVGREESLYLAARSDHDVWNNMKGCDLNMLSDYNFMYMSSYGFNDRIDPFESYCRTNSISVNEFLEVSSIGEWISNISTGRYVSFVGPKSVRDYISEVSDVRTMKMPPEMMSTLHTSLMRPCFYVTHRNNDSISSYLDAFKSIVSDIVSK